MVGDLESVTETKEALVQCGLSETIVDEEEAMAKESKKEEEKRMKEEVTDKMKAFLIINVIIYQAQTQFDSTVKEQRMKRLHFLLEKSGAYATILGRKLEKQQEEARERAAQQDAAVVSSEQAVTIEPKQRGRPRKARDPSHGQASKKRKITDADYQLTDYIKDDVRRIYIPQA